MPARNQRVKGPDMPQVETTSEIQSIWEGIDLCLFSGWLRRKNGPASGFENLSVGMGRLSLRKTMYMYMYVHMYMHMYVYMYIFVYWLIDWFI